MAVKNIILLATMLSAGAFAAHAEPKVAVKDMPPEVIAAVQKAQPGITITEAEYKARDGREYYDVEGKLKGAEIELDMLKQNGVWEVVEIQRDIKWSSAPAAVREAVEKSSKGIVPVRVIESKQADDKGVVYELFAPGQPQDPAVEVMWKNNKAEVLKERWPH
ncbi:MAG: hypothetical protein JNM81_04330 [Rhodospirillaceae bacterium]|nr:hypothetical protein [Rhodospirillaceae bacterium]